jgi:hypothetical protein
MYALRRELYESLEAARASRVLLYVTGDRPGLETQLAPEILDHFIHHLDLIGNVPRLSLVLHTRGGNTVVAWSLVNLLRQFCRELEVIVPARAHSAGTLVCLGADAIVMTKQATLGPIDPAVSTALNPQVPGAPPSTRATVSVEDMNGFIEFARSVVDDPARLADAFLALATSVHPLVLGAAFRARSQIRMLGGRLLALTGQSAPQSEKILNFLCSESGSHDYTIQRREAVDDLGLPVQKPNQTEYEKIRALFHDVRAELSLSVPYEPRVIVGSAESARYDLPRALIESVDGGSHCYRSRGEVRQQVTPPPPGSGPGPGTGATTVVDHRTFDGWVHEGPAVTAQDHEPA